MVDAGAGGADGYCLFQGVRGDQRVHHHGELLGRAGIGDSQTGADESFEKIRQQILRLNPSAEEKTIRKFILG